MIIMTIKERVQQLTDNELLEKGYQFTHSQDWHNAVAQELREREARLADYKLMNRGTI